MEELDQGATAGIDSASEVHQEKTMEDTLRDTFRELTAKHGMPEEAQETPQVEQKQERVRNENGTFAKSEAVVETPIDMAPAAEQAKVDTIETTITPPNTWKKEAQAAFLKADPVIQNEVLRREADIHKGIEQYRQAADWARGIDNAINPYKQTMQQLGITPEVAISELMAADHRLRYGSAQDKATYFAYLAKNYGIDLGQAMQSAEAVDPRLYQYQEQNQRLQQQLQNIEQQARHIEYTQLNSELNNFIADPKHSHYESVRGHMAALLQAGQAKDLEDAYEQAVYANPVTRAAVLQQQAEVAKAEAAKKAQTARAASSVNLRSRPALDVKQPIGTMDETIRNIYRSLTSEQI